jgi:hypothetical protein
MLVSAAQADLSPNGDMLTQQRRPGRFCQRRLQVGGRLDLACGCRAWRYVEAGTAAAFHHGLKLLRVLGSGCLGLFGVQRTDFVSRPRRWTGFGHQLGRFGMEPVKDDKHPGQIVPVMNCVPCGWILVLLGID